MKASLVSCLSWAALALGAPSACKRAVSNDQLDNFKLYAQWSSAAYCNHEKAPGQPVTCQADRCPTILAHNATVVASFTGSILDTRGFVGVDPVDQLIVLSFRGSSSIENWIANLLFAQVPCDLVDGCLVHAGFYASWGEVASEALAAVQAAKAANPSYRVVVTGHSLGGAIGTLAVAYVRRAGIEADLYTYGSPRVGNTAFVRHVTDQPGVEARLTHDDDPVPRLPPMIANYRHTSPEYWFDPGSDGAVATGEIKVCTGFASIACNGGTLGLNVDDHTWYFQELGGCSGAAKVRATLSHEELEAKVNLLAELDKEAAPTFQDE
ncbi:hypothetical protein VTK26DRAFT_364 [Humicola hyalothermophila]